MRTKHILIAVAAFAVAILATGCSSSRWTIPNPVGDSPAKASLANEPVVNLHVRIFEPGKIGIKIGEEVAAIKRVEANNPDDLGYSEMSETITVRVKEMKVTYCFVLMDEDGQPPVRGTAKIGLWTPEMDQPEKYTETKLPNGCFTLVASDLAQLLNGDAKKSPEVEIPLAF